MTIENSTVRGNGTDPACAQAGTLCNGLQFAQESEVVLGALTVKDNADWGIAVHASACGFAYDDFDGEVVLDGANTLEGNNASGNQNGAGNPGPPPYATLPDGQICLP